jgi:hypothetical protein
MEIYAVGVARIFAFLGGLLLSVWVVFSATRTFVLPRTARDPLTRFVFRGVRRIFDLSLSRVQTYEGRDSAMAMYAPIALLTLPIAWLTLVGIGYTAMFWAVMGGTLYDAFWTSGSSLLTLGFAPVNNPFTAVLAFSEAVLGLILVALLIAYLPTMYSAFQRREMVVTMLEVRAGSPPSPAEMFIRFFQLQRLEELNELWEIWEGWFVDIDESHTSLAALTFFRSPQPDRSWITAAGCILDSAALTLSLIDMPRNVRADLCIRAGYISLRRIADFFRIPYHPNPRADDPISIRREEFDELCEQLEAAGIPLKRDRDQAWRDYAGWRVNYDAVLLSLAALTMAPYAPWVSDRSPRLEREAIEVASHMG